MISVKPIQMGMMTEARLHVSLRDESKPGTFVNAIQQLNGNNRVVLSSRRPYLDHGRAKSPLSSYSSSPPPEPGLRR